MPGYVGTISRTAPALGMTSKALRATLAAGGLLDLTTGEPTRAAVVHGAAFMIERPSANGYYRAIVWKEDGILAAIPDAAPDHNQVLSSFRNKRVAMKRLEEAVELLRGASGTAVRRMIDAIGFAELGQKALQEPPAKRGRILADRLRPILSLIERTAAGETERDAIAVADGALRWLCETSREGPRRVAPVRIDPDDAPERATRIADGRVTLRVSTQETMLLNAGSRIGAGDADLVSSRLATTMLEALARAVEPRASDEQVRIAAGMATRTCGTVGKRTLLVLRPAGPNMIVASAHEARVDGGSVGISIEPTASAIFRDDSDVPAERDGPDRLVEALSHLLSTELAAVRRSDPLAAGKRPAARTREAGPTARAAQTRDSGQGTGRLERAMALLEGRIADLTARLAEAEARAEKAERERNAALWITSRQDASPAPVGDAPAAADRQVQGGGTDDREMTVRGSILAALETVGPSSWPEVVTAAGLRPDPTLIGIRSRMLADGILFREGDLYRSAASDARPLGEAA